MNEWNAAAAIAAVAVGMTMLGILAWRSWPAKAGRTHPGEPQAPRGWIKSTLPWRERCRKCGFTPREAYIGETIFVDEGPSHPVRYDSAFDILVVNCQRCGAHWAAPPIDQKKPVLPPNTILGAGEEPNPCTCGGHPDGRDPNCPSRHEART